MRLLLVGWDAADWKVIDPLLRRGEMPLLAALIASGVHGNNATIYPPLSPMVWTSIATGKRPIKHGIHGFTEPTEDGSASGRSAISGRKAKAFWNILNQNGKRCVVVGWWPSHPAEPINGAMVSNHFPLSATDDPARPMMPSTVHPAAVTDRLAELRVHPTEITGDILRLFVPAVADDRPGEGQKPARPRRHHRGDNEHPCRRHRSDRIGGLGLGGHLFCRHRPFLPSFHAVPCPQTPWQRRGATDPALFRDVIAGAYRYHDLMLGRLIELAGPECAVMVISDHGFHSDSLLPDYIPAEAAGPAVEHRDFGIFCLKAPGVRPE